MATKIVFRNLKTQPRAIPQNGYRDITAANPAATAAGATTDNTTPDERWFLTAGVPQWFWSERLAAEATISGSITFALRANSADAGFTGRLRCRLYKITTGGSNVETFIGQADATADMAPPTDQTYTFSFTPTTPVTVALNERFICRPSVVAAAGGFGTGTAFISFGSGFVTGECSITFTETLTFRLNGTTFLLRATESGIGNFFDLSETRDVSGFNQSVVDTTAGGTEIQWVRGAKTATDVAAAAIASTSNASTYASASFTPVANRLYLLAVVHSDAAPESTVPTVATTTGLAFVQVGNSLPIATIASPGLRLTVFRALETSGLSAGTYTVTLADSGTGCSTRLIEVPNVIATGADGADAVLNVSENSNDASANPSVSMGAFNDTDNITLLFVGSNINTVPTGGTGITVLGHSTNATPTEAVAAAWNSANDTAPDLVLASSAWAAIAVEVVVDPALLGALEWISPRFKSPGWTVDVIGLFGTSYACVFESNAAANCSIRCKAFRRTPAGVETLVATWTHTSEISTSTTGVNLDVTKGVLDQASNFAEDDRLVWRGYIIPAPTLTMGGGFTCTMNYDSFASNINDSRVVIIESSEFKASGDPDADPAFLPSQLPMMGA